MVSSRFDPRSVLHCMPVGLVDSEPYLVVSLEIERQLHVPPPPTLSVHPLRPLFEASQLLQQTHARRLPLIDVDDQTGGEVVISVLTQYRVLKFISVNVSLLVALVRPHSGSLIRLLDRLGLVCSVR
jgi:hypothetical protein